MPRDQSIDIIVFHVFKDHLPDGGLDPLLIGIILFDLKVRSDAIPDGIKSQNL